MTTVSSLLVRAATSADAAACAAIYAPYVTGSAISFETEPPTADEMAQRITDACRRHAWLVLDTGTGTGIAGYAYGHAFSARPAYQWSCETSIYMDLDRRGQGGGRTLYQALLTRLTERGHRRAFAGIAQPNDASNGLHRSLGFSPAGLYRNVGWKNGAWHDVAWMQLDLQPDDPQAPPHPIS